MKRSLLLLALLLTIGGCGYFNSLYNARRQFAQAERNRREGSDGQARSNYNGAITKAAKSYRKYPDGRWSDDALYLIGRSRFHLDEFRAARAAFDELLKKDLGEEARANAQAYAGATAFRLNDVPLALSYLDSALAHLEDDAELSGFAHHWRARARSADGDRNGAWADLDAIRSGDAEFAAAQLTNIALGISVGDSARTRVGFERMLSGDARRYMDTVRVLAMAALPRFGAPAVRAMLASTHVSLAVPARDSLTLLRARVAARAGDTVQALQDLSGLAAGAAAPTAAAARILSVRLRLATVTRVEELADLRATLLAALTEPEAIQLLRTMRIVSLLVERAAATGESVGVFAAAELARDELAAPELARRLFISFADVGKHTPWAPKALLAAIAIAPDAPDAMELRQRLIALPPNPYSSVVRGDDAEAAYESAEERLQVSLASARADAARLAESADMGVSRAVATIDSLRALARADTVRIRCGLMLDTLAIGGVRKDSVRVACLRSDTASIASYMKIDTMVWRLPGDTAKVRSDTIN